MRWSVFGVDLEGEPANRAAIAAFGDEDALAVAGENGEDALEGFGCGGESGIDDHGAQKFHVLFEYGAEKGFFAVEEVIEAAGIDLGVGEKFGHAGTGKAAFPEEEARGVDETVAGGGAMFWGRHRFFLTAEYLLPVSYLNDQLITMKNHLLIVVAVLLSLVPVHRVAGQSASGTSVSEPPHQFVIEVEVPGPVPEVWKAFATSEGLSTWLFPNAKVDLRPGGDWLVHFPGGSTGGGTILSFIPEKEIVIAALAPDQFPHVRATRTHAVFQFEARGKSTVVRLTQTGWQSGDEWTRAYEYLAAGNAQLLASLHRRFVDGPVDWEKAMGNSKAKSN
jgi:uncharacterized protein YndB with AHSA1/START domain